MQVRSWSNVNTEQLNESITRKMIWGENVMVTRWELAPHTALPTHDHVSEQVTMVQSGSVTLLFPHGEDVTLSAGDMLVIPSSVPHGVRVGPEGCTVLDIFSPIRRDFIEGNAAYLSQKETKTDEPPAEQPPLLDDDEKYRRLHGFLAGAGVKVDLDELKKVPLEVVALYVYDRECITLGDLRKVMGWDKKRAKEFLRDLKHGDDHSGSSLKRKMERLVILPGDLHPRPRT
jgi:quercetin dioxygenase-like cupin family protein